VCRPRPYGGQGSVLSWAPPRGRPPRPCPSSAASCKSSRGPASVVRPRQDRARRQRRRAGSALRPPSVRAARLPRGFCCRVRRARRSSGGRGRQPRVDGNIRGMDVRPRGTELGSGSARGWSASRGPACPPRFPWHCSIQGQCSCLRRARRNRLRALLLGPHPGGCQRPHRLLVADPHELHERSLGPPSDRRLNPARKAQRAFPHGRCFIWNCGLVWRLGQNGSTGRLLDDAST